MSNPNEPVTHAELAAFEAKWKELLDQRDTETLRDRAVLSACVVSLSVLADVAKGREDLSDEDKVRVQHADAIMRTILEKVDSEQGIQELRDLVGADPERQN